MPHIEINGNALYYDRGGEGEPVVMVHGSWTGEPVFRAAAQQLREDFEVVTYDRAGYNQSEAARDGDASRRRHEEDLAALVEALGLGPVHLIGTSMGAAIALAVAGRRPELVRSVVAYEPPLVDFADHPAVAQARVDMQVAVEMIEAGDHDGAARRFIERAALGPGGWERLPELFRTLMVANAEAVRDEIAGGGWETLDVDAVRAFSGRKVVGTGSASPAWFGPVVRATAAATGAEVVTIPGAAHSPHSTHTDLYVATMRSLLRAEVPA